MRKLSPQQGPNAASVAQRKKHGEYADHCGWSARGGVPFHQAVKRTCDHRDSGRDPLPSLASSLVLYQSTHSPLIRLLLGQNLAILTDVLSVGKYPEGDWLSP